MKEKFCGNCGTHVVYEYPNLIFCSKRFDERKNPIVETLWCCEDWNQSNQKCFCIEEATKNKGKR